MTIALKAADVDNFRQAIESGQHIYYEPEARYVVSLIVSYGPEPDGVRSPKGAAAAALRLTRDEDASGTHWQVYDRDTGLMYVFEQDEFADMPVP